MNYFKNLFSITLLAGLSLTMLFVSSCGEDEKTVTPGTNDTVSIDGLKASITEAKGLLTGAEEGFELGNYQIGSIVKLQDLIDKSQIVVDSDTPDAAVVASASTQLKEAIAAFKASEVTSIANPWVQQVADNRILLTDSDAGTERGLLGLIDKGKNFTIELKINSVSNDRIGFSNSLISAAKQFNADKSASVDDGFHIRYFDDGGIQFINGAPDGSWTDVPRSDPGVIKVGVWQHVAYVHDGQDRVLYIDGVEIARGQLEYESVTGNTAVTGISIGNSFDWVDRVGNAMFKDIRIWSKALAKEDLDKQGLTGTGEGLEAWFPMASDQGNEFVDVSGNYKAVFGTNVPWAPNGDPTQVPVDYAGLEASIAAANTFIGSVTEGTGVGDFGVGTKQFVQRFIDEAQAVIDASGSQSEAVAAGTSLDDAVEAVKENTVEEAGVANGLLFDLTNDETIGLRITRTDGAEAALPEESYSIEVEVFLNDFIHPDGTETSILGTGALQFRTIVTKEGETVNPSTEGKIEFYVEGEGWTCACSDSMTMIAGEWVNLAAVYDAGTNTSKIYLNGVEVATGPNGKYTRRNNNGWLEMWLGNRGGNGNRLDGKVRDLRVWSIARSAADVNGDINGDEAGLEMYFPLDVKSSKRFIDETGNYFGNRVGVTWNP